MGDAAPWQRQENEPTIQAMNTAKKFCESDDQGVVHVDVPIGRSRQCVEVLVVWEDVGEPNDVDHDGPDMADLVGLLQDVDIERPPQGAYEKRDPIT
ncbi:MAG: hypothetical protein HUU21_35855 [Polyangiaceae bacterium]|nr:hypothetical protein [Polyangiaceae bacterium]